MQKLFLAPFLAALPFLAAATSEKPAAPEANAAFRTFVDDYFAARFARLPSDATSAGIHDHDGTLEDYSRTAVLARVAALRDSLERLAALQARPLGFDEAIDAAAIEGQIRGELLDLDTIRELERNPMPYAGLAGNAVDVLMKRDFAPAAERLRSVVSRLEAVPGVYAAARANLRNPPREFTDLAIRVTKGSVGFFEDDVAAWARGAAGADTALLAEFESANATAVRETTAFAEWLERDVLPRSKGRYAIGRDNFAAKLRYDEQVEAPLAEVLARGEAQLAKDYQAFGETARRIDPARSPAEVMRSLTDEHPSAEELIPSVRRSLEAARTFLVDHGIVSIPSEVRPLVEETPPYARSGSFASMDTPGPFERKAKEAFYYVTPVEKDWDARHKEEHLRLYNPYVVAMINVHEAWPGHYLQFLYAPRFPTKTRQLVFSGTNVEGWAHYTEQMMVDEGFGGGDPRYRLAQLQEALLRDCRYVVGIKLHTAGMTVEEGAQVFVSKGFQEPANALEEARRGAYNPTYLYYTLGKLEIQALRDEYRARKSASLEEFHDVFVSQGGLPIPLVRRILLR